MLKSKHAAISAHTAKAPVGMASASGRNRLNPEIKLAS
jgi:hypothetical protein